MIKKWSEGRSDISRHLISWGTSHGSPTELSDHLGHIMNHPQSYPISWGTSWTAHRVIWSVGVHHSHPRSYLISWGTSWTTQKTSHSCEINKSYLYVSHSGSSENQEDCKCSTNMWNCSKLTESWDELSYKTDVISYLVLRHSGWPESMWAVDWIHQCGRHRPEWIENLYPATVSEHDGK